MLALILFYGWAAEVAGGLAAITGAYVAGVLVGRQEDVREWVKNGVSVLGYGIFVPVFFVTVGLRTDLHAVLAAPGFVLGLTAVAVVTKALGAGLGARLSGCTWRDTNTIGAGMVARGEVALRRRDPGAQQRPDDRHHVHGRHHHGIGDHVGHAAAHEALDPAGGAGGRT